MAGEAKVHPYASQTVSDVDDENIARCLDSGVDVVQSKDTASNCTAPSNHKLLFNSVFRTVSAALYIFDFVSNLLVLKKYYYLDFSKSTEEYGYQKRFDNQLVYDWNTGSFSAMAALMVIAHIGNGVAFKLVLPPEEHPLRSAYFLPLIQFRRLVSGIMQTILCGSRPSSKQWHVESEQTEALYAIMSASIEAGPLFLLQYTVVAYLGSQSGPAYGNWRPSNIYVVSIVGSGLSAAYNSSRAIRYKARLKWSYLPSTLGAAGGLFSLSALMLRAMTLVSLVLAFYSFDVESNTSREARKLRGTFSLTFIYATWVLFIPFVTFWALPPPVDDRRSHNIKWLMRTLKAMASTYVSASLGPLYPLVSHARRRMELKKRRFHGRLLLLSALYLLLEVSFLLIVIGQKQSVCSQRHQTQATYYAAPRSSAVPCSLFISVLTVGFVMGISSVVAFVVLLIMAADEEAECTSVAAVSSHNLPVESLQTGDGPADGKFPEINHVAATEATRCISFLIAGDEAQCTAVEAVAPLVEEFESGHGAADGGVPHEIIHIAVAPLVEEFESGHGAADVGVPHEVIHISVAPLVEELKNGHGAADGGVPHEIIHIAVERTTCVSNVDAVVGAHPNREGLS